MRSRLEKKMQMLKEERERELSGVVGIPFGLLAGFADEKEIEILELAENGFRFRQAAPLGTVESFRICFYENERSAYREWTVLDFELTGHCAEEIGIPTWEYCVFTGEEGFRSAARKCILQYDRYVQLKLTCEDAGLAEQLCDYPAALDEQFADHLAAQKKVWFSECANAIGKAEAGRLSGLECALELDCPERYERYSRMPFADFVADYWECNQAAALGAMLPFPSRIYIGNTFCHLLFPEESRLFEMLEKAKKENLSVTISFPYLRDAFLEETEDLLGHLADWCEKEDRTLELAGNDWGLFPMLADKQNILQPVFGTQLNKRKKDPRMAYKKGETKLLAENSLNAAFYRDFLRENFGIRRIEWEACAYPTRLPSGKNSLHLPFYQTNTSQYCPLYAVCKNGDRGRQKLPEDCPEYCRDFAFCYPEHLQMLGRYNSLFALDPDGFCRLDGVDRIVVGLL